jgi:hypothetical protein
MFDGVLWKNRKKRTGMVGSRLCTKIDDLLMLWFLLVMLWHDDISWLSMGICSGGRIEKLLRMRIGR